MHVPTVSAKPMVSITTISFKVSLVPVMHMALFSVNCSALATMTILSTPVAHMSRAACKL